MSDDEAEIWETMLKSDGLVEIERDLSAWTASSVQAKQENFKESHNNACNTFVLHSVADTKAWVCYYLELYKREERIEAMKMECQRWHGKDYDETLGEM